MSKYRSEKDEMKLFLNISIISLILLSLISVGLMISLDIVNRDVMNDGKKESPAKNCFLCSSCMFTFFLVVINIILLFIFTIRKVALDKKGP